MSHCVSCTYWQEDTMEDNLDGRAICLKLTELRTVGKAHHLLVIRTRGDHGCDFHKPLTVGVLGGEA